MAINITIKDTVVDHSSIYTNVNGSMDDANIIIEGTTITNSKLFTDLNVSAFCSDINRFSNRCRMSCKERKSIQKVLGKQYNREAFIDSLAEHIISFAEGVAANVVADLIMGR